MCRQHSNHDARIRTHECSYLQITDVRVGTHTILSRLRNSPLSMGVGMVRRVRAKSGIKFTFHDLRRTFLTMGEKLDVPPYALKRMVNHSVSNDMTGRYLILDLERLRSHMSRSTEAFVSLLGINDSDMKEWKPAKEPELTEVTQLLLPIDDARIL